MLAMLLNTNTRLILSDHGQRAPLSPGGAELALLPTGYPAPCAWPTCGTAPSWKGPTPLPPLRAVSHERGTRALVFQRFDSMRRRRVGCSRWGRG
ncbi:MAG: hypothetical protein WKG07_20435 [Hymenobacter sp.]